MKTQEKTPESANPHEATLTGKWFIRLYGEDGKLKQERSGYNVITTNGKEALASLLAAGAATATTNTFKYVAIGSDSTTETAANTALGTELGRHTGTVSYISNAIYQVTATFATGSGTGSVYEYGLLNSNTGGTLLSRDSEALITKGASDTLTVTCQITIS